MRCLDERPHPDSRAELHPGDLSATFCKVNPKTALRGEMPVSSPMHEDLQRLYTGTFIML